MTPSHTVGSGDVFADIGLGSEQEVMGRLLEENKALRQQLAVFRAFVRAWDARKHALDVDLDLEAAYEAGKVLRRARAAISTEMMES